MNIYESIYKYCLKLNISNDNISRALFALQQMELKGIIYSEELRRQLGEIIPEIYTMTAQSLGYDSKDMKIFNEKIRNGEITWRIFSENLPRIIERALMTTFELFCERWKIIGDVAGLTMMQLLRNDIINKGQSILTDEQKENLINTGKL